MKSQKELNENPQDIKPEPDKEAPIQTAYRYLTTTDGVMLELMTRANPTMAKAAHLGYIFTNTILHDGPNGPEFGNHYVEGLIGQVERFGVSDNGRGRAELIEALTAGGRLPDTYYNDGSGKSYECVDD